MTGAVASEATLAKIAAMRSADVARRYQPSATVFEALKGAPAADGALRTLLKGTGTAPAIELLAHALPRREAVWWAATCVRDTLPEPAPGPESRLIEASEAWVRKPSDDARRAAYAIANQAGMDTAGGLVAMAVFFAGDSLAPAGQQAVPPPGHLVGAMVINALRLAATRTAPEHAEERFRNYLEIGLDIASGGSGRKREPKGEEASP
ncbi:MAG: hypothetical protein PHS60_03665 [Zavarzinia sp.]|nr:hypothetical protein [Zavarzinia sp.]